MTKVGFELRFATRQAYLFPCPNPVFTVDDALVMGPKGTLSLNFTNDMFTPISVPVSALLDGNLEFNVLETPISPKISILTDFTQRQVSSSLLVLNSGQGENRRKGYIKGPQTRVRTTLGFVAD